jgi:hypothetical protein
LQCTCIDPGSPAVYNAVALLRNEEPPKRFEGATK